MWGNYNIILFYGKYYLIIYEKEKAAILWLL